MTDFLSALDHMTNIVEVGLVHTPDHVTSVAVLNHGHVQETDTGRGLVPDLLVIATLGGVAVDTIEAAIIGPDHVLLGDIIEVEGHVRDRILRGEGIVTGDVKTQGTMGVVVSGPRPLVEGPPPQARSVLHQGSPQSELVYTYLHVSGFHVRGSPQYLPVDYT